MRRFNAQDPGFDADFAAFLDEPRGSPAEVDAAGRRDHRAGKGRGLRALLDYARRFDGIELDEESIHVTPDEIAAGAAECALEVREAIAFAATRIRAYHERQRPADARFTDEAGVELGWRWTALEAVGVYVPGGRGRLSLQRADERRPASVAGVERIAMVTPPGRLEPAVLAAAKEAG